MGLDPLRRTPHPDPMYISDLEATGHFHELLPFGRS